jgi:hypothetical protein
VGSVLKITRVAQSFGLLFPRYQLCIHFARKLVGVHFGRLFRKLIWDRCYDFFNFAEKFSEKIGVFDSKQSEIMQNFDHNIGF